MGQRYSRWIKHFFACLILVSADVIQFHEVHIASGENPNSTSDSGEECVSYHQYEEEDCYGFYNETLFERECEFYIEVITLLLNHMKTPMKLKHMNQATKKIKQSLNLKNSRIYVPLQDEGQ